MPYASIKTPAPERAAAAVYGTVAGLVLSGQDDAADYVLQQLDTELLRHVRRLVDSDVEHVLADAVRRRTATGETTTATLDRGPDPRVDEEQGEPATCEEQVKRALRLVLQSTTVRDVVASDAFGALVYRVKQACERDGVEPIVVLKRLDADTLGAASGMLDPAAYLTKHVRDWSEG